MKTLTELTDTMNTKAAVYDLAQLQHEREGTGATYQALERARKARTIAAAAVDGFGK